MRLFEALEKRSVLIILIFGLGALIVLLDYLNPFVDFFKTWNMYYVVNHLGWYMLPLVPTYFILGILIARDDTMKIYISFLFLPAVHYVLKSIVLVYLVFQDPSILQATGSWYGGYILDWRDFAFLSFAIYFFFIVSIGTFCIVLMTLGLGVGHFFGPTTTEDLEEGHGEVRRGEDFDGLKEEHRDKRDNH